MITPIDIQTKEFSKSLKGYKESDVDSFLDEVTVDYEKLFKENVELKDKVGMLSDQVKHYSNIEQTIQKTLVMAQTTAEEVTLNARKKAEGLLEDSEKEIKRKIEVGNEELKKIKEEYERVRKEMMLYKARCKSIISSQLEMIESELEEFSFEQDKKVEVAVEKGNENLNFKPESAKNEEKAEAAEASQSERIFDAPEREELRADQIDPERTTRIDISGEKAGVLE